MHQDEELHDHGDFCQGKKLEGNPMGKVAAPFPKEKAVMSIYVGPAPHKSQHKLKLTNQAINVVSPTVLKYQRWSESPISFDRTDHLDSIPKPGRFPLIVDPLVGMTWLTKALMDGGSGLNLMYLDTFERWGLPVSSSKAAHIHFTEWSQGSSLSPMGGSLCRSPSEARATTALRHSRLRWSTFLGLTMSSWGGHVTSSSWPSPTIPISSSRYPGPPGLSH
jgi:hypothetical protein